MSGIFQRESRSDQLDIAALTAAARSVYEEWDNAWPKIRGEVEHCGVGLRCSPGCNQCCFGRKFCSVAEGAAIVSYLETRVSRAQGELYRMRVESVVSSLRRLRKQGICSSDERFFDGGGMQCPFLLRGECGIYQVRPLACRAAWASTDTNASECRRCPKKVYCEEPESARVRLSEVLAERETHIGVPAFVLEDPPPMIPEVVSALWRDHVSPPASLLSEKAWELRLQSSSGPRDETWHDDGEDFQAVGASIVLPAEGDYPPDLTLACRHMDTHELYNQRVSGEGLPDFCSLYKRHPGCSFDWESRQFVPPEGAGDEVPYTIWMSDGLQERLMMWEAAKRCRGRVLCGGLGLGVFPQYALALPQVDSVHIVEADDAVIAMINQGWAERPWPHMDRCTIVHATIEDFLSNASVGYDTVYLDTWDALYHEYLPHLNWLARMAESVVERGGEILEWGYDLIVRQFLETAVLVIERRQKYLAASPAQLSNIANQYPMLHSLVTWLHRHPNCHGEDIKTEAYRIATREQKDLGSLKLSRQAGAGDLLHKKYFEGDSWGN